MEDAIAWANDCEYGLTSSIYTQNLDMTFKLIRALKFGETYVNRENFEAMQGFHADGVNLVSAARMVNMGWKSIYRRSWFIWKLKSDLYAFLNS